MSDLHFTTQGEGPPLVFVHGLAGSTRWWRHNTEPLASHFKVYLVDLPGFGRSRNACDLEGIAASLPRWLDALGLERVHLVGHSMGGFVSLRLAATQPQRVARLALINAAGMPVNVTTPHMLRRLVAATRHGAPGFIPTVVGDGLRAGIPYLLRLTGEICQVDVRPLLPRIQAPTLVLWGTRDTLLPPALGQAMAEAIPGARFHFIPRAGHNAMADRPALVNRYLLDFFTEPPAPAEPEPSPHAAPALSPA